MWFTECNLFTHFSEDSFITHSCTTRCSLQWRGSWAGRQSFSFSFDLHSKSLHLDTGDPSMLSLGDRWRISDVWTQFKRVESLSQLRWFNMWTQTQDLREGLYISSSVVAGQHFFGEGCVCRHFDPPGVQGWMQLTINFSVFGNIFLELWNHLLQCEGVLDQTSAAAAQIDALTEAIQAL